MIGDQPPLADVLADLGQWLQEWTSLVRSQIGTQAAQSDVEDGLPPVLRNESGAMTAAQTAVSRQGSSPPAHWLALFAEQGDRSLEEAATHFAAAAVPVKAETGRVDTAVLTAWIAQMQDSLLAFRQQVDPEFAAEQAENMPEAILSDVVPAAPLVEGSDERPLDEVSAAPNQTIPQPQAERTAEMESERPLPPSPPAVFPPSRLDPLARNMKSEIPSADTQVIQRKAAPTGEPVTAAEGEKENGPVPDLAGLPHPPQPPPAAHPAVEAQMAWPERPPSAPLNAPEQAEVFSPRRQMIKQVTRLRLDPLPQRETPTAQRSRSIPAEAVPFPAGPDPVGSTMPAPSSQATWRSEGEVLTSVLAENHGDTAVASKPLHPAKTLESSAAASRLNTAVPTPPVPNFGPSPISEPIPQPSLPRQKTGQSGNMVRIVNSSPAKQTRPPLIQAAAAPPAVNPQPTPSPQQPPAPPVAESRNAIDRGEAERPLPPNPLTSDNAPSFRSEPENDGEGKRPSAPQKRPDYQIPLPAGQRRPPQWSVTPENRWPSLPPLPSPAPNPALTWRQQPARRQRLDREQQGTSWNE